MCMYISVLVPRKYLMRDIPEGVLLLYTNNRGAYTARLYSTTSREFTPDPILHRLDREFKPEAPLLEPVFHVDNSIK